MGQKLRPQSLIGARDKILGDLDVLYERALADDNLAIALKVKELQGKFLGLCKTPPQILPENPSLNDLNDEQMEELLETLYENTPAARDPTTQNMSSPWKVRLANVSQALLEERKQYALSQKQADTNPIQEEEQEEYIDPG